MYCVINYGISFSPIIYNFVVIDLPLQTVVYYTCKRENVKDRNRLYGAYMCEESAIASCSSGVAIHSHGHYTH